MTGRAHNYLQRKKYWKTVLAIYQEDERLALHMCYFAGYKDFYEKLTRTNNQHEKERSKVAANAKGIKVRKNIS